MLYKQSQLLCKGWLTHIFNTPFFAPGYRHHGLVIVYHYAIPARVHVVQIPAVGVYQTIASIGYAGIPTLLIDLCMGQVLYLSCCHCYNNLMPETLGDNDCMSMLNVRRFCHQLGPPALNGSFTLLGSLNAALCNTG